MQNLQNNNIGTLANILCCDKVNYYNKIVLTTTFVRMYMINRQPLRDLYNDDISTPVNILCCDIVNSYSMMSLLLLLICSH